MVINCLPMSIKIYSGFRQTAITKSLYSYCEISRSYAIQNCFLLKMYKREFDLCWEYNVKRMVWFV